MQLNKTRLVNELAAVRCAIGGGWIVHRLTSTWGFIDWWRRRMAAVPGPTTSTSFCY